MPPSIYFPQTNPSHGQRDKLYPFSNGNLPSAVNEKLHNRHFGPWVLTRTLPLPGSRKRRLRVCYPNTSRVHQFAVSRFGQKKGTVVFGLFLLVCTVLIIGGLFSGVRAVFRNDSTVVFRREELQRIWKWEIESGHYPSRREIPPQLLLKQEYNNPSLPPPKGSPPRTPGSGVTTTNPMGPKRRYLTANNFINNVEYPPRPIPGSVADLDRIMDHCDFSQKKYVRDCHEFLRAGAGLDNNIRFRRAGSEEMSYIYVEEADNSTAPFVITPPDQLATTATPLPEMKLKAGAEWEAPLKLNSPDPYRPHYDLPNPPCDEDSPRIFHMFWAGPFTDKPYMAILSFLFTQNTGLHLPRGSVDNSVCRPQLWLWINPGSASSVPNQSITREMFDGLKSNPWSAPFLHPRFKDVVNFKLWNTTEQLDGIPEIKNDWAKLTSLFNSGGHKYNVPIPVAEGEEEDGMTPTTTRARSKDEQRAGSQSASTYDKLSVIMSDIARFVLCHQYGGIYLDADTIFLRDWEELWGWKGAFAYRWSRLPRYNTAVLRLSKKSALGSFIFRTALMNDMDVHPFKLSVYAKQAMVDNLLLRLPDALFDPAWLNTEDYQLDRPAQPVFTTFLAFFDTPAPDNGSPSSLGFSGFFRGAFSYHFHNYWWKPFDPARNWPDLGPRFIVGERKARKEALATATLKGQFNTLPDLDAVTEFPDRLEDDKRDLDWATVMKRTFESYMRGERPNMYGESLQW